MTECEGVGKNIEKAIEDALLKLKADKDDVDIKILDAGGLFKKAKVLVKISDDCISKYLQKNEPVKVACEKIVKVNFENEKINQEKIETFVEKEENNPKENERKEQSKDNVLKVGKTFLEGFVKTLNLNLKVEAIENEDEVLFSITGEDANSLIGYRGECLNNLQYVLTVVTSKNNRHSKHARLDIDGYREKRKQTLEALARRVASKVEKTGKQYKLEPMSAYERRIIHTTVQEFENVTSVSKGEEPHRYLIIKKEN